MRFSGLGFLFNRLPLGPRHSKIFLNSQRKSIVKIDPALFVHNAGPHIFINISVKSQRNSKIFYGKNHQGPRWDCFINKKSEVENLVRVSLQMTLFFIS
jgi:hypothetical protein